MSRSEALRLVLCRILRTSAMEMNLPGTVPESQNTHNGGLCDYGPKAAPPQAQSEMLKDPEF